MSNDIIISAATRISLQQLQALQAAGADGPKLALRTEAAVVEPASEARGQHSTTTSVRGTIVDILA